MSLRLRSRMRLMPTWAWLCFSWCCFVTLGFIYAGILSAIVRQTWQIWVFPFIGIFVYIIPAVFASLLSAWISDLSVSLKHGKSELGMPKYTFSYLLDSLLGFFLGFVAIAIEVLLSWAVGLATISGPIITDVGLSLWGSITDMISSAILPALTEELLFRGFMLQLHFRRGSLTRKSQQLGIEDLGAHDVDLKKWRFWAVILLNALLFCISHIPTQAVLSGFGRHIFDLIAILRWFELGVFFALYSIFAGNLHGPLMYHLFFDFFGKSIRGSILLVNFTDYSVFFIFFGVDIIIFVVVWLVYRKRFNQYPLGLFMHSGTWSGEQRASLTMNKAYIDYLPRGSVFETVRGDQFGANVDYRHV